MSSGLIQVQKQKQHHCKLQNCPPTICDITKTQTSGHILDWDLESRKAFLLLDMNIKKKTKKACIYLILSNFPGHIQNWKQ